MKGLTIASGSVATIQIIGAISATISKSSGLNSFEIFIYYLLGIIFFLLSLYFWKQWKTPAPVLIKIEKH
jgi:predicted transporter